MQMQDHEKSQIILLEKAAQFERVRMWDAAVDIYHFLLSAEGKEATQSESVFPDHYITLKLSHVFVELFQWEVAEELIRDLLAEDAENAQLWADMGRVLIEQNRVHEGLRACKMALMLDANLVSAQQSVVRAFIHRHQWDKARSTCDKLLRLEPDCSIAIGLKGVIEMMEGEDVLASDLFNQAVENDPNNAEIYVYRCMLSILNRRWESMVINLETALNMHADIVQMQKIIINPLVEQGFYDEAEQCLEIMIEHAPDNALLYVNWAHILRLGRNYQDALAIVERALAVDADLSAAWVSFVEISMDECPSNIVQILDRVIENNRDNEQLLVFCAHVAFQASMVTLARELVQKVKEINADNVMAGLISRQLDALAHKVSA